MERLEELLYRCNECYELHGNRCNNECNCDIDKEISQNNIKTLIKANENYKKQYWHHKGNFQIEEITPSKVKILSMIPNKKINVTLIESNKLQIELI